jgi:hypothetical protein
VGIANGSTHIYERIIALDLVFVFLKFKPKYGKLGLVFAQNSFVCLEIIFFQVEKICVVLCFLVARF